MNKKVSFALETSRRGNIGLTVCDWVLSYLNAGLGTLVEEIRIRTGQTHALCILENTIGDLFDLALGLHFHVEIEEITKMTGLLSTN